jgi:serine/threonine protein kinase
MAADKPRPDKKLPTAATALDIRSQEQTPSPVALGTADTLASASGGGSEGGTANLPVAGMKIRQYELIRELGRGGMGRVFLARDTRLGRLVAIKFLATSSKDLTERFLVEARTTAALNHENIVVIHEVDEHEGMPYMVLEFLEGQSLAGHVERKRIPFSRAIEIAVPIVRALVRAHASGIVHRDLKPDNVFVTSAGAIKVLDFGIAKFASSNKEAVKATDAGALRDLKLTGAGAIVGTLPYMSPEQLGMDAIDERSDIWALGIILWELSAGRHPLAPYDATKLMVAASELDVPIPAIAGAVPEVPERLARVIDRCLAKRKAARYPSAKELLADLESLLPGRQGRQLSEDESPYPGLTAFQEGDADRFFGRGQDVARMVTRLRETPLVAVVGPSGIGKSSFVRAGVVPALRASGEEWDVRIIRPGRSPLASLASLLLPLTESGATAEGDLAREHEALMTRLRAEPGYLGTMLRARALRKNVKLLLFIDQFEEAYTLVPDAEERRAFTACLSGVADDATTPLRIAISIRSDFLDRAGEDRRFLDELTRGLIFLQPLGRSQLREALTAPLDMRGYGFEHPELVEDMLTALESTHGALPLLQFAAARLWDSRDRQKKLLTSASYDAMGGITGTLASHADEVLGALPPDSQKLVRALFQRLVTPERTRAIVDLDELRWLGNDPKAVDALTDHLVQARLLVVQQRGDLDGATAVEIVHESLITGWPTLRRWLDESQEDAAFLSQLRTASKQWEQKGRPAGLLWRGEAMEEARLFQGRFRGELPANERAYLHAVLALATRSSRIRRGAVIGVIVFLSGVIAVGGVAMVHIRNAETAAKKAKSVAEAQTKIADQKTKEAQASAIEAQKQKQIVQDQLDEVRTANAQRDQANAAQAAAENQAQQLGGTLAMTKEDLAKAYDQLKGALAQSEQDRANERAAKEQAQQALVVNKQLSDKLSAANAVLEEQVREYKEKLGKVSTGALH